MRSDVAKAVRWLAVIVSGVALWVAGNAFVAGQPNVGVAAFIAAAVGLSMVWWSARR
jgi:hypothetical protein